VEKRWFALCDANSFISTAEAASFSAQLKGVGGTAVYVVALRKFISTQCPRCGASGHFKAKFLGGLRHPDCKAEWYVGPGSYILFQLTQTFHGGAVVSSGLQDKAKDRAEHIMNGIFGYVFGFVIRGVLALFLIPIQAVVSLSQSKPTASSPKLP
jgi:hypothetical protein